MSPKRIYLLILVLVSLEFISCRTRTKNVDKSETKTEIKSESESTVSIDTQYEVNVFEDDSTTIIETTETEFNTVTDHDGTKKALPSKQKTTKTTKSKSKVKSHINANSNVDSTGKNNIEIINKGSEVKKSVKQEVTTKTVTAWLIGFVILFFVVAALYRFRKIIFPFLR